MNPHDHNHGMGKADAARKALPDGSYSLPDKCPRCGKATDTVADSADSRAKADHQPPEPGDFTICLYCGDVRVFNQDHRPRDLTPDEAFAVDYHPQYVAVRTARRAILRMISERRL